MKKHSIFLILILVSLFLNGCKYDFILPEVVPEFSNVSFSKEIVPIFTSKCISCHNTQAPVMTADVAYSQLVPKYVNTTSLESAATSLLLTHPGSSVHSQKAFTASEAKIILVWIKEGAKNN